MRSAFKNLTNHNHIILHKSSQIMPWLDSIEKIIYNGFYVYHDNLNKVLELVQKYNFCPFIKISNENLLDKNKFDNLQSIIENTPCEIIYQRYDYLTFTNFLKFAFKKFKKYSFIINFL